MPNEQSGKIVPLVPASHFHQLRQKAEAVISRQNALPPRDGTDRLQYELRVQQIELEMQNEQLRSAQEEADRVLEKYVELYDCAPVGYLILNKKGLVTRANLTSTNLLGVPRSGLINRPFFLFVHRDDYGRYFQLNTRLAKTLQPQVTELRLTSGAKSLWVRVEANVRQAEAGDFETRLILSDITERIQSEQLLRESQNSLKTAISEGEERLQQLSSVFLNATDAIIIEDLGGKIIEANREAERAYGYTRNELIGSPVTMLFKPERHQRARALRKRCCQGEDLRGIDGIRLHKSGQSFSVLLSAFPLRNKLGQVVAVATIAKDISLRKKMEAALKESRTNLRDVSRKTIEALEADRKAVSRELHDSIGASLAAIKFMLEEAAAPTSGSGGNALSSAFSALSVTIKEVKRISLNLRPLSLDDIGLIATLQGHLQRFQIQNGITCELQIDINESDIPDSLKIVIYRVLQEALANVSKHSRAEKVAVLLQKGNDDLSLIIRDNGEGFDANSLVPKDPLSGYGLKSMRERVEICQGFFMVKSAPGLGTEIRARLPIANQ